MKSNIHRVAALTATLCVLTFFLSTIIVELYGSHQAVTSVKGLIVMPGLFILIPAIAVTGATGMAMSLKSNTGLIAIKRKRMPLIGANGILVLIPSAIVLSHWASAGKFDTAFYVLQSIELLAGSINLTLMYLNIRDGRILKRKTP